MSLTMIDHGAVRSWLAAAEDGAFAEKSRAGGPPAYSTGTWNPGPAFVDFDRTRRAPTPGDLAEAWRSLIFGCSVLNANAVARQPLRLYLGSRSMHRPKGWNAHLHLRCVPDATIKYLRSKAEFAPVLKGADEIDEVTEHPLLTLFSEINPAWDHIKWIRYSIICLDIFGRAHSLPGDDRGFPTAGRVLPPFLWPLLPQYVIPYRDGEGSLATHYMYFSRYYDPENLINFRADSLRDPYALGQSCAQAAFGFASLQDRYTGSMENILTQSVKPSVIVTNKDPEEPFGDAERRRLQRDINYQLSMGGQGKAWVVDGSIDVKSLNFPPTSLAENEISETAVKYVSFIFGVPLSFIRNEDSNRAVAEAGHYQHAKLGVEPRCVNFASTLTKWTHAEGRRRGQDWSRLLWAFDNPVKEDEEREAKIWDTDIKNGSRTVNERRMHLGFDRVAWGDEPWYSNTLVQPSTAEDQRKQQAANAERQFNAEWGPGGDEDEAEADDNADTDQDEAQAEGQGTGSNASGAEDHDESEAPEPPKPKKPGKASRPTNRLVCRKAMSAREAKLLEAAEIALARITEDLDEADDSASDSDLLTLETRTADRIMPVAANGAYQTNGAAH